ncbi:MAG TPA: TetR family transcriptional regulator [Solirubrobacteraceae bacterium]|nr:TetR family transcriptional regulator [Solirubrobacteraceae bacterium]
MSGEDEVLARKARQGAHVVEMQRRRLLSAMTEVLVEYGYESATVGRICKRAGVSRRTFYDLYDDREACLLDAFEEASERLAARVVPAYTSQGHWRDGVRSALVVLLECFDLEPGLARLCLVETLKGGPLVLERRHVVTIALTGVIDAGRQETKAADPPSLTAESLVGGIVSVIHTRLAVAGAQSLVELTGPLMSMIVLPYLGPAAARKELERPLSATRETMSANGHGSAPASDPFRGLPIRITFRTVRVLSAIGEQPDASNREIGNDAGVVDQGQMSKLLRRLEKAGLIENRGHGQVRGEANAWRLTSQGQGVLHAVGRDA